MDLKLTRYDFTENGIFSRLTSPLFTFDALEHAYPRDSNDVAANIAESGFAWLPKIPNGTYTLKRSMHRLHGMTEDFETFMLVDVPGHSNILIHWGNYNHDSDGCILIGKARAGNMVTESRQAFAQFMEAMKGLDTATLTVS